MVAHLGHWSDWSKVQASVAIAMTVDSVFVCFDARGHIGRSQQQLLQLVREKIGKNQLVCTFQISIQHFFFRGGMCFCSCTFEDRIFPHA